MSLPEISLDDGAVRSLGVLHEHANGLIQAVGGPDGLLRPQLTIDGAAAELTPCWRRDAHWVPHLHSSWAGGDADAWYCTPVGERGAAFRLRYRNLSDATARATLAWAGAWADSSVAHLRVKPLHGEITVRDDPGTGSRVAAISTGLPLLALGLQGGNGVVLSDPPSAGSAWLASRSADIPPGGELTADVYLGVAPEPDGAAVTALHLRRRGFDALLSDTLDWLSEH